jgi:hypothetical protein
MEENIIQYKTAILAKEKGFDLPTQLYYESCRGGDPNIYGKPYKNNLEGNLYYILGRKNYNNIDFDDIQCWSAPTQTELQKWLREVHKLHPNCDYRMSNRQYKWGGSINSLDHNRDLDYFGKPNNTYEEGLEEGLYKALKLIKK